MCQTYMLSVSVFCFKRIKNLHIFPAIKHKPVYFFQMVSSHHIYMSLHFVIALINWVMDLFTLSRMRQMFQAEQMESELNG